jgi:starvation-inducible DNA-binding protein
VNSTELNEGVRQQVAQNLGLLLADMYVLYTKTQNYHWNVVDARFYSIHIFLEKQYEDLAEAIDEVAERIRMLGERSPGTLRQFLEMTSLKEAENEKAGNEMLQDLKKDHEKMIGFLRTRIPLTAEAGDEGTADLFIQQLRFHEKSAWMLRSHLESVSH